MRTAGYLLGAVLAASLGACAHPGAKGPAVGAVPGAKTAAAVTCPMARLAGVHATVADIHDGVAITFTGPAGTVDQLRGNVHAMADANDKQKDAFAACPCAQRAVLGSAEAMPAGEKKTEKATATHPSPRAVAVLANAKVDEIATGAVLKLTAKDKADVGALRTAVREDVHALRKSCLTPSAGEAAPTEKQGTKKP
jgi:hypothetical protein